jgi:hypothetical protein
MNSYGLILNLGYHLSTTSTQMQLGAQNLVFLRIVLGSKELRAPNCDLQISITTYPK